MKHLSLFIFGLCIFLCSCSSISDKSVSEKLNTKELSKAIKADTLFSDFYQLLTKEVEKMDDIKKAKYNDVTYRRLFKYVKFLRDTSYWNPLSDKYEKEWEKEYGHYMKQADSTLNYWKKSLEENSLNKYVKVELAKIDKEYYSYSGGIKDVNLGFKLTPLNGTVEQIRFNYGYKAKINGDNKYYEKHNCISTSPFSSPTVRYWEVKYSDRDNFSNKSIETFLRDYNVYIEITKIRINGVNISTDDFSIPKEVSDCLENEKDYPALFEMHKDDLIRNLISKSYTGKWDYIDQKANEIKEKEDKLCFSFIKGI